MRKQIILTALFLLSAAYAQAQSVHSISEWTACDGKTDDSLGVAKAFAAAANGAFSLKIDCPVFMHVGMDITRPVFINNGTHVSFDGNGLLITDNVLIPAFVIANSSDVVLTNWKIKYSGGLPIDHNVGGYMNNGVWAAKDKGYAQPSFAFNDQTLKEWLKNNRGITFDQGASSFWHGPTDMSAIFYVIGNSSQITVNNLHMFAASVENITYDPHALNGADKYIPVAFAFEVGYDSNSEAQKIAHDSWPPAPNLVVPHDISFDQVTLNGYYMGFVGAAQNISFKNVTGLMYADLMDAQGGNVGGVGKWFAPPHLFYLKYYNPDHPYDDATGLKNLTITNTYDQGQRSGTARDHPGEKSSGYADSMKIGGMNVTVTNYTSLRPDGLADLLSCNGMTLNNVTGTYDSSFLNDIFPGIRFPANGYYQNLTLNGVILTDTADDPYSTATKHTILPISYMHGDNNSNVVFNHVTVNLKRWSKAWELQPKMKGDNINTPITFNVGTSAN